VALIALREPKGHVAAHVTASNAGEQSSTRSSPKRTATPSKSTSPAPRKGDAKSSTPARTSAKSVPLVVLNNTTISGLAERAAQRFEDAGWTVTRFGNYQNDILSTCAYYDPSVPGAERAANALQREFPAIKRVKERFPELPSGEVVVVLTPDYSPA
jgi:LytR cell envelope-related transcriptional attenuator